MGDSYAGRATARGNPREIPAPNQAELTACVAALGELKTGARIPDAVLDRHDKTTIARAVVERLRGNRSRPRGATIKVDDRRTELKLFFNSKHLGAIAREGFRNTHQTGTSTWDLVPGHRLALENKVMELSIDDAELLPKYAMLSFYEPDLLREVERLDGADDSGYGDVVAVFDDEIKARSTYTLFDSLGTVCDQQDGPDGVRELRRVVNCFDGKPRKISSRTDNRYFEAQIYGPLGVEHVKYFMVQPGTPQETIDELKVLGKPIFNAADGDLTLDEVGVLDDEAATLDRFGMWLPGACLFPGEERIAGHRSVLRDAAKVTRDVQEPWAHLGVVTDMAQIDEVVEARLARSGTGSADSKWQRTIGFLLTNGAKNNSPLVVERLCAKVGITPAQYTAAAEAVGIGDYSFKFDQARQLFDIELPDLSVLPRENLCDIIRALSTQTRSADEAGAWRDLTQRAADKVREELAAVRPSRAGSYSSRKCRQLSSLNSSLFKLSPKLVDGYWDLFADLYDKLQRAEAPDELFFALTSRFYGDLSDSVRRGFVHIASEHPGWDSALARIPAYKWQPLMKWAAGDDACRDEARALEARLALLRG